jgi:hypothetical protein
MDSRVQVRQGIKDEVDEWVGFWIDVKDMDVTYEMKYDLIQGIFDALVAGGALDPLIAQTVDYEDEHYN